MSIYKIFITIIKSLLIFIFCSILYIIFLSVIPNWLSHVFRDLGLFIGPYRTEHYIISVITILISILIYVYTYIKGIALTTQKFILLMVVLFFMFPTIISFEGIRNCKCFICFENQIRPFGMALYHKTRFPHWWRSSDYLSRNGLLININRKEVIIEAISLLISPVWYYLAVRSLNKRRKKSRKMV